MKLRTVEFGWVWVWGSVYRGAQELGIPRDWCVALANEIEQAIEQRMEEEEK